MVRARPSLTVLDYYGDETKGARGADTKWVPVARANNTAGY